MSSKTREIRKEPWQCCFHGTIVSLLSLSVLQQLQAALADEPTPGHSLVLREVNRALDHMTFGLVGDKRGRPRKAKGGAA
jgi:hypothetical protein